MKSKKIHSPKVVIVNTLILFLGLILVASASSVYYLSNDAATLKSIVGDNIEQQYLFNMNRAASQRIIYLNKMLNSDDPFDRDEIYILYMKQGELFLQSSIPLKKLFTDDDGEELWQQLSVKMKSLANLQNRVIEIILQDYDGTKIYKAEEILNEYAVPAQDSLLKFLSTMLDLTQEDIKEKFEDSVQESETAIRVILFITLILIFFGIVIGIWVLRHFQLYEKVINIEKDKAIRANLKKSQFLANMSHEIRTPLTAIIGFSNAIQQSRLDITAFENFSKKISHNGKHLLELINEVLDLSKIEAGELTVENIPTSPIVILDEVITIVSGLAEKKGIEFESNLLFPIPGVINSDPVRLKQILINLCSNAIKFTEKGTVIINVNFDHLKHKLFFKVIDTGIGMSADAMKRIFLPFSQADMSTTRKFGGTGLGLNISKRLSEKLNGELSCSSIEGVGSEFIFEMDVGEISNETLVFEKQYENYISSNNHGDEDVTPDLSGSILLVEDSKDNCDLIGMYIDETNADYSIVENGQLAVEEYIQKKKQFDLILMDMQMPIMDGFEAITMLRENGYKKPIVMLTANALKSDVDKSVEIGADGFLVKPIELDKFYKILTTYLKQNNH